jgi:hypothetical protein
MRSLAFLAFLVVLSPCLAPCRAQSPAPAALPEAYKLIYEVDNLDGAEAKTNRLEVVWEKGQARLTLDVHDRGEKKHHEASPWPESEAAALWQQIETAKLFDFKPQQGDATPHFSPVRITASATVAGAKKASVHAWSAPLKNDGQVWALVDLLQRLMATPPAAAATAPPSGSPEPSK